MDIKDMHVYFRQYAQQMGMQNVRGILPEQIDITINTAISDYTNQSIAEHLALTNDRVNVNSPKVGQVNVLRTLYKVDAITISNNEVEGSENIGLYRIEDIDSEVNNALLYISDFKVDYTKLVSGINEGVSEQYDVRLIDSLRLGNTLHDYILRPTVKSPIAVYHDNGVDVYFGEEYRHGNKSTLGQPMLKKTELVPNKLYVGYIKVPAKVSYANNIDCDML